MTYQKRRILDCSTNIRTSLVELSINVNKMDSTFCSCCIHSERSSDIVLCTLEKKIKGKGKWVKLQKHTSEESWHRCSFCFFIFGG